MLTIHVVPALQDNYAYLIQDSTTQTTAVVDPSEAAPVLEKLKELGWKLDFILNTHHHYDHVGGNLGLKSVTGAKIVGHKGDASRIPGIDVQVDSSAEFALGNESAKIIAASGHTQGHILFWFENSKALFSGDTLFSLGCGRLFEGTPENMWQSLGIILNLPPDTKLYCGHEYTVNNAQFALTVDPSNEKLKQRQSQAVQLRNQNKPTIPSTLEEEFATNPFLRPFDSNIRKELDMADSTDVEVFAEIRRRKDHF